MPLTDAGALSEFHGYNGDCGQCALEVAMAAAHHRLSSAAEMNALVQDMQAHNEASSNGASTVSGLADTARRHGETVLTEWDYAEPMPNDWHSLLLQYAGVNPIIFEVGAAHNLVDAVTGSADEPGVNYHYIVVLDKQVAGYVANDGDNPAAGHGQFNTYSYGTLQNASICGVLMIQAQQGAPVAVPSTWHDDGTTITAPNGKKVTLGFAQFIRDNAWADNDLPMEDEVDGVQLEFGNPGLGKGNRQRFLVSGQLSWNGGSVFRTYSGKEIAAQEAGRLAAQAALANANSALSQAQAAATQAENDKAAAQQALAQAQAQVASLTQQLAQAQAATAVDPSVKTALSAALNLLSPSATIASDLQAALATIKS